MAKELWQKAASPSRHPLAAANGFVWTWPRLIHGSLRSHESARKRHLERFSRFLQGSRTWPTNRPTDRLLNSKRPLSLAKPSLWSALKYWRSIEVFLLTLYYRNSSGDEIHIINLSYIIRTTRLITVLGPLKVVVKSGRKATPLLSRIINMIRYDTIRYGRLTCAQKLKRWPVKYIAHDTKTKK